MSLFIIIYSKNLIIKNFIHLTKVKFIVVVFFSVLIDKELVYQQVIVTVEQAALLHIVSFANFAGVKQRVLRTNPPIGPPQNRLSDRHIGYH